MFMSKYLATAAVLACTAFSAQAATISAATGLDLGRGDTESNTLQVFSEAQGVVVAGGAVTVDYLVGANLSVGDTASGVSTFSSGQSLTAGTYNSFLVHFDPMSAGSISNIAIDFGETIVGIIVSNSGSSKLLNSTDGLFGTAAAYDDHLGRRTEDSDSFVFTNGTTLTFSLGTNATHIDNIRVLTEVAAVPLPASLPLLVAGFAGLGLIRRRR